MTAKKQLTFAALWASVYTLIFNIIGGAFSATIVEIILATCWVFLLFLVATYSRIFFFTVIPIVFVTSGMVAYAEWLMHAPISRDVVASVFQTNWQEMHGVMGSTFLGWSFGALLLAVLCTWHLLYLKLKHHRKINLIITTGFLAVFWICTDDFLVPPEYGNVLHWHHPYDYLEYIKNFTKE
ncbi:MAG: phosphoethanolamine transferase domain-containing protein [Methylococcaceae bacterium]